VIFACPECGADVEGRRVDESAAYPGAMVWKSFQVRLGPEHARRCRHWRREAMSPQRQEKM
jgi:hypothetical protein